MKDIRTRREALGLSQEQLAAAARITLRTLCAIERGERKGTMLTRAAIEAALDCAERGATQAGGR